MARRQQETERLLRYVHSDGGHNYTMAYIDERKVVIKTGLGNAPRLTPAQSRYIANKLMQFADDIEGVV